MPGDDTIFEPRATTISASSIHLNNTCSRTRLKRLALVVFSRKNSNTTGRDTPRMCPTTNVLDIIGQSDGYVNVRTCHAVTYVFYSCSEPDMIDWHTSPFVHTTGERVPHVPVAMEVNTSARSIPTTQNERNSSLHIRSQPEQTCARSTPTC